MSWPYGSTDPGLKITNDLVTVKFLGHFKIFILFVYCGYCYRQFSFWNYPLPFSFFKKLLAPTFPVSLAILYICK